MNVKDLKVISGGTTGADLAGLWAASLFGIPTGGCYPRGSQPELTEFFGLTESDSGYHGKSLQNCEVSDLTLIFASDIKSSGTKLTIHHCISNHIHYRVFCLGRDVEKSIDNNYSRLLAEVQAQMIYKRPVTLNVAGNSTATSPQAFTYTFLILCKLFEEVLGFKPPILHKYDVKRVEFMLRDCYNELTFEQLSNIVKSDN